ncbi:hypothetical protein JTB14_036705 [Gonioctena quinquepunctata]|nr:hypothetical protein JTB14_036705 [Gonioctena quinquepunctata]
MKDVVRKQQLMICPKERWMITKYILRSDIPSASCKRLRSVCSRSLSLVYVSAVFRGLDVFTKPRTMCRSGSNGGLPSCIHDYVGSIFHIHKKCAGVSSPVQGSK